MGEEDLRERIKELSEKIERLEKTLDRAVKPYSELMEYVELFRTVSRGYFKLMDLYQRYGEISPDLIIPGLKDPISREVVKVLFDRGASNITQITQEVRKRRGTASRRIVRERLHALEEAGVVVREEFSRERRFSLTDDVVTKWSQVLGLFK